jgi:hypothetical protein
MLYCPRLNYALTRLFPNFGFQIITETGSLEDLPCLERDKRSNRRDEPDRFRGNSNDYRRTTAALNRRLKSGVKELALELESKGYKAIMKAK